MAELVEPRSLVKTVRLNNQRVSLPSAHRVSHPPRVGILRELSSIEPDVAPDVSPLEELHDSVWKMGELHGCRKVPQDSGEPPGVAVHDRIVSLDGRRSVL